jgi:hypothetical protein
MLSVLDRHGSRIDLPKVAAYERYREDHRVKLRSALVVSETEQIGKDLSARLEAEGHQVPVTVSRGQAVPAERIKNEDNLTALVVASDTEVLSQEILALCDAVEEVEGGLLRVLALESTSDGQDVAGQWDAVVICTRPEDMHVSVAEVLGASVLRVA